MELTEIEINEIVRNIWELVLNEEIHQISPEDYPHERIDCLSTVIQITGAWEGSVVVTASEKLVRHAAATMFNMKETSLITEYIHDALNEITNMIGGNIKAMLPAPSALGLSSIMECGSPTIVDGFAQSSVEVAFLSQEEPLLVKVFTSSPSPLVV